MHLSRLSLLAAASAVVFLSACSSGPSESDVRAAFEKNFDAAQAQSQQLFGSSPEMKKEMADQKKQLADVKLIGCKEDGEKAYKCDVEIKGRAGQIRMVKGSDGWLVSQAG